MAGAYANGGGITSFGTLVAWGNRNYQIANPSSGDTYVEVDCGQQHCCALDDGGEMSCWGANGLNNALPGTWTTLSTGSEVTCALDEDGLVSCDGWNDYSPLPEDEPVLTDVACGTRHCCGLTEEGLASCWGAELPAGQLTASTGTYVSIEAGPYHTCALSESGSIDCWGNNAAGQCDVPAMLR